MALQGAHFITRECSTELNSLLRGIIFTQVCCGREVKLSICNVSGANACAGRHLPPFALLSQNQ